MSMRAPRRRIAWRRLLPTTTCSMLGTLGTVPHAHASMFSGDTLDAVANVLAWIVLFIAPAIGIAVFWIVHILPERIAEKRGHPQAGAIKMLCLLSLVFGGLLWPLAWLWAYSKPVLYKLAYGTDVVSHGEPADVAAESHVPVPPAAPDESAPSPAGESVDTAAQATARAAPAEQSVLPVDASQRRTKGE